MSSTSKSEATKRSWSSMEIAIAMGDNFNGLCRVNGERSHQQAFCEKAANALDEEWCPSSPASASAGSQQDDTRDLLPLVSSAVRSAIRS
jgi:hypothetical protein